jgi:hypothetical protein
MGATPALLEDLTGTTTRDASFANAEVWLSLHSANPGSSGANEITSGSGAAGRQQVTFSSGGSGADSSQAEVDVTIVGAHSIPWYGYWTAQTGGTFLGGYPLVGPMLLAANSNGDPLITCPNHGLAVNDPVRLFLAPNAQSQIPVGYSGDPSVYYVVVVVDSNTVILSATLGGGDLIPSSAGAFFMAEDLTEVFTSSGGVLAFAASNIVYETVS